MSRFKFKNTLIIPFLIFLSVSLSGCIYLIVGGVAAAGGYAISRDTIQGETDKGFDEVWSAAVEVMGIMGMVDTESYELGQIIGIVNGARVTVTISQVTPSTVRLQVKARKAIFPSIANAQNVYVKIMDHSSEAG